MKILGFAFLLLISFPTYAQAYDVIFNTKTLIYHSLSCEWGRKCTKRCQRIDSALASHRGGVPCKVCGGMDVNYRFNDDLTELDRLKAEMSRLRELDLERMRTIAPTFDSDYQTLHDAK